LSEVGYCFGKKSDPDKIITHFSSRYLPKANNGDENIAGKKQAHEIHEMRGVLLTILCYCML